MVPLVVPFTTTLTPGKAPSPSAEVTLPVSTRSWAQAEVVRKSSEKQPTHADQETSGNP